MLNNQIGIRFDDQKLSLLKEICSARGEDISSFTRRAILKELANMSYLNESEKKALGIKK